MTQKSRQTASTSLTEEPVTIKFGTYRYEDFLDKTPKKHRYFILINKETLDKRILSLEEEVRFAGKYLDNPTILGFRNLNDAKAYLAGPRTSQPMTKPKKKDIYSHERKESPRDLYENAEAAKREYAKKYNKDK